MAKLFTSLKDGEEWFHSKFGTNETFDATVKTVHLWGMPALLFYINGLVDGMILTTLLTEMQEGVKPDEENRDDPEWFLTYFPYYALSDVDEKEKLLNNILSGQVGFVLPDGYAFLADLRSYPGRSPEEPDTEKVIRGSRDGFTENIILNTALIRRRLRTENLRFEMHQTTVNGKTDVAITFMKGAASEEHLSYIRERLDEIKHDGLTMTDKSLEEFLFKQRFHPMPFRPLYRASGYLCSPSIGRSYRNRCRYIAIRHFGSCDDFSSFAARGRISASAIYRYVRSVDSSVWCITQSVFTPVLVLTIDISTIFADFT